MQKMTKSPCTCQEESMCFATVRSASRNSGSADFRVFSYNKTIRLIRFNQRCNSRPAALQQFVYKRMMKIF